LSTDKNLATAIRYNRRMPNGLDSADAIVVGAGLAGLVATAELADAGRRVILVDQEPEASLGGQAFWSLGGLMLVDSPEQRRLRIRDSRALAWQDWLGTAASTGRRTRGRGAGPRPMSTSAPGRSARGSPSRA
jgi:glycine/D-amino acid oxidase-like deaminating enzyme